MISQTIRRLRLRTLATVPVAAVALAMVLLSAPSASAWVAPNMATYFQSTWTCDIAYHSANVDGIQAYAQPGWRSQWVRFRFYVKNVNTGQGTWSGSADTIVYPYNPNISTIGGSAAFSQNVRAGQRVQIYTEYRWWNGSAWSAPVGSWGRYLQGTAGGLYHYNNVCYT